RSRGQDEPACHRSLWSGVGRYRFPGARRKHARAVVPRDRCHGAGHRRVVGVVRDTADGLRPAPGARGSGGPLRCRGDALAFLPAQGGLRSAPPRPRTCLAVVPLRGGVMPLVPGLVAALFGILALAIVVSRLSACEGTRWGILGGLALVAMPCFPIFASNQQADVPVSVYLALASALIAATSSRELWL